MTDFRLDPQRTQQAPAADAERHLLQETDLVGAAVELSGDAAIGRHVQRIVAVEEVQGNSAHPRLPASQPNRRPRAGEADPYPRAVRVANRDHGELGRRVDREGLALGSRRVDRLTEVAVLVEQTDAYEGYAQVAGPFEVVPGHVSESARVHGQRLG
jgi:hypothetical protein